MLIYLRHGDDRGSDIYQRDRRLTDRGKKKASKRAGCLIEKYGHPDIVYVSPFRRTLETLDAMSKHFERAVTIHRDPRVAQHLRKKQRRDPRVSPETLAQVTINEDREAFLRRVAAHVEEMRRHPDVTIWCITHQTVIKKVADHFNVQISRRLDFLDHVIMRG